MFVANVCLQSPPGPVYNEMLQNLLDPLLKSDRTNFVRLRVVGEPGGAGRLDSVIGRAAHIALLEDDLKDCCFSSELCCQT
eukprot:m.248289 g.248289  ORF g.248289 m.248289 type:complete len:81 (-) comp22609_c4_seq12:211-453(-)